MRLQINDVDRDKLAEKFPSAVQIFMKAHKISADISLYGMMNNLQGGGILKLYSTPMEIACRYRNHKFSFRSIGEGILNISGSINWHKTHSLKVQGFFDKIDIKEFMSFWGRELSSKYKGIMDGYFKISGEVKSPVIESKIEIQDAEFGNIKFDVAYLNLQGTGSGPINLQHSMVYYKDVPAELKGYIDLSEKNIFKNIEIKPTEQSFIMDGINIEKNRDDDIVKFGKDLNKNVSIHFKSAITSDPEAGGEDRDPEVKLEYKLNKDKNLLLKMQEDEGTVGVEQKVKF